MTSGGGSGASLDRLEEKVKLLLARHEALSEQYRELEARQRRAERGGDPVQLAERIDALQQAHDRLSRHAAFLEDRIRDLLSRTRYVVEA